MKKCPYCGKEYPDEATNCAIDNELLSDNSSQLATVGKKETESTSKKDEPYFTFPDYKWSARDAWKCLGAFMILTFVTGIIFCVIMIVLRFPNLPLQSLETNGLSYCLLEFLAFMIFLLPTIHFARTKKTATFLAAFGLDKKPTANAWFGLVMAFVIRFAHFHLWQKGNPSHEIHSFENTFGFERYLFLVPLLVFAPVFEEIINRGFLYKAFRGSYSMEISMILLVVWTAITHWSQYFHSSFAVIDLSILTLVQCYLRERSASLWDCIICHFVFNASLLFISV